MNHRSVFVARSLTKGGVGRFVNEILYEFDKAKEANFHVVTDDASFSKLFPNLCVHVLPKAPVLIWDNIFLLLFLLKLRPISVLYPKNIVPLTHLFMWWKKIIVVHDLAFMYPELKAYKTLDTLYMRVMLPISLNYSSVVSCDSQFTRDEIVKFFPWVDAEKLKVIPLGVRVPKYFVDNYLKDKLWPEYKVLLYVGSISPRKNVLLLIKIFVRMRQYRKIKLVLVVARSWSLPALYSLLPFIHKDIVIINYVDDKKLNVIYQLSDLFVFPSKYEGFGLPVLEALVRGTDVVVSKAANNSLFSNSVMTILPFNPMATFISWSDYQIQITKYL